MPLTVSTRPSTLGIGDLLHRIAMELEENANVAERCQTAIGAILPAELPADVCEGLQGLDTLSQTVLELSALLQKVANSVSEAPPLDGGILGQMRLSALHDRLAGLGAAGLAPSTIDLW